MFHTALAAVAKLPVASESSPATAPARAAGICWLPPRRRARSGGERALDGTQVRAAGEQPGGNGGKESRHRAGQRALRREFREQRVGLSSDQHAEAPHLHSGYGIEHGAPRFEHREDFPRTPSRLLVDEPGFHPGRDDCDGLCVRTVRPETVERSEPRLRPAQPQVSDDDLRADADRDGLPVVLHAPDVGRSRLSRDRPDAAEDVELPTRRRTAWLAVAGFSMEPQWTAAVSDSRSRATELEMPSPRAPRRRPAARALPHAGDGFARTVAVRGQRALDERGEHRVVELAPPTAPVRGRRRSGDW